MSLSVLENYILSLVDRGLCSKYELQRQGGVSIGSSSPALARLKAAGLVREGDQDGDSKRIRQVLQLTSLGRKVVRNGWRRQFRESSKLDMEAIFRVVDMAAHYGATRTEISLLLETIAAKRAETTRGAGLSLSAEPITALHLQQHWASERIKAEANFLLKLAEVQGQDQKHAATAKQGQDQKHAATAKRVRRKASGS